MWPDYRNECHLNAHLYSLMCCAGQCVCVYSVVVYMLSGVAVVPVSTCFAVCLSSAHTGDNTSAKCGFSQ